MDVFHFLLKQKLAILFKERSYHTLYLLLQVVTFLYTVECGESLQVLRIQNRTDLKIFTFQVPDLNQDPE